MSEKHQDVGKLAARTDELAHEYGDLVGIVPYAGEVVAAYRFVRQRRVRSFLRGLGGATAGFCATDNERFRAYINSLPGRELLAEFAEASLRSRTQTATAALALLYADFENRRFSAQFKSDAVAALEGLTDRSVEAFLLLSNHASMLFETPDQGPFKVVAVTGSIVAAAKELSAWSTEASAWVGVVTDLIQRGLLATDWAAGSRQGGEDWMVYFAFSSVSSDMKTLLGNALATLAA